MYVYTVTDLFSDSELMKLSSMQLVGALELMVSNSAQWLSSLTPLESSIAQQMHQNISNTRTELVGEILTFLKVCSHISIMTSFVTCLAKLHVYELYSQILLDLSI